MGELSQLPNIGKKLEELLEQAGITNPAELQELGSKEAFDRLLLIDETACMNKLYALEGAIQGIRWHQLSENDKKSLKEYYHSLK
ncbi:TfoX/Sxy family protein [Methanolobus sediminis]|uniref:TfoX/Sxy family protein n=1 Tax=Methanolobus sediminis TaxID=3072978 RepID=A0AA51YIW5_9EURY|nr:TfoX/Sxy family protein [Methanolobus sediminis]WMW24971.1 TfoX/Sxy family protein [Methanolobus sediminis]